MLQAQRPTLFLVTLAAITQVNVNEVHVGSFTGHACFEMLICRRG